MSGSANGMHISISDAEADFRRSFNFEDEKRLHQAIYEAGFHDRSIPLSDVTSNDVLGGQGRGSMYHSGSAYFRDRCRFYKEYYFRPATTTHDQWAVRRVIIDEVLSRDGRFLFRRRSENCWKILTYEKLHKKIQNRLWEKDSPPTVAGTVVDIRPASATVHPDANGGEDHPSTVAGNAVDSSPTSTMVDLDGNSFLDVDELVLDQTEPVLDQAELVLDQAEPVLDQAELVLDTSDFNEDIDTFELDEADWSYLLSL